MAHPSLKPLALKRLTCGLVFITLTTLTMTTTTATAMAGSIERLNHLPMAASAKTKIVVVDLRDEKACEHASLPGARCLPASSLFDKTNHPLTFYALRWLLGTIGLTGQETVVLYAGNMNNTTWAAAGLLYLAGQNTVAVLDTNLAPLTAPGQPRSFSREAVYTAPMRDALLRFKKTSPPLGVQLAAFAHNGGTKAITIARPSIAHSN